MKESLRISTVADVCENAARDRNSLYSVCKQCPPERHCCSRASIIVVLPAEAARIVKRTGRPYILQKMNDELFTIVKRHGWPCPLLTDERLCSIYDIRPTDCRSWPLTLSREPYEHMDLDMGCPAAVQGMLKNDFILAAELVLDQISPQGRSGFIELVHREADSLPLSPFSIFSNRRGSLVEVALAGQSRFIDLIHREANSLPSALFK